MKKLLFLHVPKCGGSTFHEILARNTAVPEDIYPIIDGSYSSIERLRNMPKAQREKYAVFGGHYFFGIHELFDSPCAYITFLRHPVRRVISNYLFIFQSPTHFLHKAVCPPDRPAMPLLDFVNSGLSLALENQTVLMLGNRSPKRPEFVEEYASRVASGGDLTVKIPLANNDWRELLEQAKANITAHFACVGLSERFDESLSLMADCVGLHDVRYEKINVTRKQLFLKPVEMQRVEDSILKRNYFDVALYDHCVRLFDLQLQRKKERLTL